MPGVGERWHVASGSGAGPSACWGVRAPQGLVPVGAGDGRLSAEPEGEPWLLRPPLLWPGVCPLPGVTEPALPGKFPSSPAASPAHILHF